MRRLAALICLLALGACGYRLAGDSVRLPHDIRTLQVVLFENRTSAPYLENTVSEPIIQRLLRLPELRLLPDGEKADAVLSGAVVRYDTMVSAYDALDVPRQYRAEIEIEAQLQRPVDGRILWRGTLRRSAEFAADADRTRQADFERLAQQQIAVRLAEDLSYQLATDF